MPSLFTRFKRSGSVSSVHSDERKRRASTASTLSAQADLATGSTTSTSLSPNSPQRGTSGSTFVEDFGDEALKAINTPTSTKGRSEPLALPLPTSSTTQSLGTPKLVLTEEGSNSPRSFSSSPAAKSSGTSVRRDISSETVGLGLGGVQEVDLSQPRHVMIQTNPPSDMLSIASAPPTSRPRSDSNASGNSGSRSRSGSIVTTGKLNGDNLRLPDKKTKRDRRKSGSSQRSGIAAALAKGGLAIAHPIATGEDIMQRKRRSKRSPFLTRNGEGSDDDLDLDEDEDDDDDESDFGDDLPVHGFAVASNRRNSEFHSMFPSVDEGDYLIEDYGCALSKDILVQGRLYVSESHICFHANILGWVTDLVLAFTDIRTIEKKMTALVIPNAIMITTNDARYTFASFISRDTTFDVLMNIWRLCNPNAVMSSVSLQDPKSRSRPASVAGEEPGEEAPKTGGKGHGPTQCSCGKEGKHLSETALDATFPSTPEKIFNLMFNSGWFKSFLTDDQKLRDVEYSDWQPAPDTKILSRSTSYIKPLNGSIGPKQTKCHITDEQLHCDYDDHIIMLTTTKTPDVPSGGVFSVKTRTCFMWAGANSTKIIVTTQVEWTGKSWVKGIIEKSAIDGQKQYHDDLDKGMRAYIKEHHSEFAGEGGEEVDVVEVVEVEIKPTEAEEYAARTRRERQNQDLSGLQYAFDTLSSGVGNIFNGLKAAFDAIADLLNNGPIAKEFVLGAVILLLLLSNIYTYIAYRPTSSDVRRQRRMGHSDGNDMAEAMRLLLQNAGTNAHFKALAGPAEEAKELERLLDEVENRATNLRELVRSAVGGETRTRDLD